jgi:DNA-binding GntR family transcriptional regulator
MIVNNVLPAGSSHLETERADMQAMSRTPIREAAIALEAQGLVEVRPRRGIRILPLSTQDMAEVYDILTELEGLAADQAARRTLSPAEIGAVEATLDAMDRAVVEEDRDAWADSDWRFHDLLVQLSNNHRLKTAVDAYNDQVHRARMLTLRLRPAPIRSNQDHRALFDAIRAGDPDQARALHTAHRKYSKDLIIGLLEEHGFRQF